MSVKALMRAAALILSLVSAGVSAIEIGEDNIVNGDCQDLVERIEEYGVWDESGYHPGQPGNTHVQVETRDTGYRVSYRTDEQGRSCAFTQVRIRLSVSSVSSRIDWQPESALGAGCNNQRRQWHETITRHEEAHVADNRRLEKAYNRDAPVRRYEACDDTEEDAWLALNEAVSRAAGKAVTEMLKRIHTAVDHYHQRQGTHIPMPQCCQGGHNSY
ncbi:MAG: hypothetical protein ABW068_15415 [Candidatus Thiodiazotropha sp.]